MPRQGSPIIMTTKGARSGHGVVTLFAIDASDPMHCSAIEMNFYLKIIGNHKALKINILFERNCYQYASTIYNRGNFL